MKRDEVYFLSLEIFKYLLNTEKASGEEISKALGISRATLSRRIKELNEIGLFVNSDDTGYSIPTNIELWQAPYYLAKLRGAINYRATFLERCESSQDIAEEMAKSGAEEGSTVICGEIKSARGRLGRKWFAPPGGLWFSLVLRPKFLEKINLISLAMALSVSKAIDEVIGVKIGLKWPNDLLIKEKKVGGILSEAKVDQDGVIYAIIGVGINMNNSIPDELKEIATTLKEAAGGSVPILPILGRSLYIFGEEYMKLSLKKEKDIIKEWKLRSITVGRRVRVQYMDEIKEGIAVDIDFDGALIVKDDNGNRIKIYAGDIIHLSPI
jgi:BirA family biotin operon repressor/biotin-[acetyl-CoA-carboxylase] ligase